jgi:hypothetical protein
MPINEIDASNLLSWARGLDQALQKRLEDFDDNKEVRGLIRVSRNFISQTIKIVSNAKFPESVDI